MSNIFAAVDIGGTKTLTGLVDERGTVLSSHCFPTVLGENAAEKGKENIIRSITAQCSEINWKTSQLSGTGIVCAGPVDCQQGTIENPYTLPGWKGYPLTEKIKEKMGGPCRLDNDANGMLMGEVFLKKLHAKTVLMMTIGTGIGVAVYRKGSIYRANGKYHPEMGHIIVDGSGPECYCGHPGCFESLCSGSALHKYSQDHGYADFNQLYKKWRDKENKEVSELMKPVKRWIRNGFFSLMLVFKPDVVILGGGFGSQYYDFYRELIEKDISGLTDFFVDFRITRAEANGCSALIGAAMLAGEQTAEEGV